MNLGIRAPQKEEVRILDYKADPHGNALYQIQWLTKDDIITWQPLTRLKQFYPQIKDFEKEYRNRDADWSNFSISKPSSTSAHSTTPLDRYLQNLNSRNRVQEKKRGNQVPNSHNSNMSLNLDSKPSQRMSPSSRTDLDPPSAPNCSPDLQTKHTARPGPPQQQSLRIPEKTKVIPLTTNNINLAADDQNQKVDYTNSEIYNQDEQQDLPQRRMESREERLKRRRGPLKEKESESGPRFKKIYKKKPRIEPQTQQIVAKQILDVYQEGRDWWAHIITVDNQHEDVLRDALRVNQPELLLEHYQEVHRKLKQAERRRND